MYVTDRQKSEFIANEFLLLANDPLTAGAGLVQQKIRKNLEDLATKAKDGTLTGFAEAPVALGILPEITESP